MYRTFFLHANPEMISFVSEGPNQGATNIQLGLEHAIGNVSRNLIKIASTCDNFEKNAPKLRAKPVQPSVVYVLYEYYLSKEQYTEVENLILTLLNTVSTNKMLSCALLLTADYFYSRTAEKFAMKIIANCLMGLEDPILDQLLNGDRTEHYPELNLGYSLILSKCLRIKSKRNWEFDVTGLHNPAVNLAKGSLHCSEYGLIRKDGIEPIKIRDKNLIKNEITNHPLVLSKKKSELLSMFYDRQTPIQLQIAGRASELLMES